MGAGLVLFGPIGATTALAAPCQFSFPAYTCPSALPEAESCLPLPACCGTYPYYCQCDQFIVGNNRTLSYSFSDGFDIKNIGLIYNAAVNTLEVTWYLPCQAGNSNPSPDAECHALNGTFPGGSAAVCEDCDPETTCNPVPNTLPQDAPEPFQNGTSTIGSEHYTITLTDKNLKEITVHVDSSVPVGTCPNVLVDPVSVSGTTVSPTCITFNTSTGKHVDFTITLPPASAFDINDGISYLASANAEYDGPGEDNVIGSFTPTPPTYRCVYKTFNGMQTLALPKSTTFPVDLTVEVEFANDSTTEDLAIAITDSLQSGLSYVTGSTTCPSTLPPNGVCQVLGDPAVSGATLTWAGPIIVPPSSVFIFDFKVSLQTLASGQTVHDCITVLPTGLAPVGGCGTPCQANVTVSTPPPPPPGAPGLNQWGFAAAVLLLGVSGIYFIRRRTRSQQ